MRTGRVTQTIWNRSVKKQIQKVNRNSTGKTAWEESSSELISDEKDFVWSSTSVSGKAPAQVKYAVIKSAGDLAAKRVRPTAVSVQILFPESSDEQELKKIMRILTEICEETGLAITCVQAESAEYVLQTVIHITAVGVKENPKQQMKKCFPGTEIILCGYTGLEGTLRLVEEAEADLRTRFTPSFIEKTKRCKESLILPKQILKLPEEAKSRQCGDGGVLCGLWELAEAEKIGFEIDFSKLALKQETVEICEFFQLNPYLLTSAGSYLVLTEHGEETLESLKNAGVLAVRIGFVKEQNARTLVNGEETRYLDRPAPDELSRWWNEKNQKNKKIEEAIIMLNIVLYEPEIPANTGNIGRTCVATGTRLHLIEPLGFKLNEKSLKRAGMDYWNDLDVTTYIDYQDFLEKNPGAKIYMATTKAHKVYTEVDYEPDCYIMFGKESAGIPEEILVEHEEDCMRIPMNGDIRSLNLGNSVAIVLYEALRQNGFAGMNLSGELHELHWK